jgi:hypothetical protein
MLTEFRMTADKESDAGFNREGGNSTGRFGEMVWLRRVEAAILTMRWMMFA